MFSTASYFVAAIICCYDTGSHSAHIAHLSEQRNHSRFGSPADSAANPIRHHSRYGSPADSVADPIHHSQIGNRADAASKPIRHHSRFGSPADSAIEPIQQQNTSDNLTDIVETQTESFFGMTEEMNSTDSVARGNWTARYYGVDHHDSGVTPLIVIIVIFIALFGYASCIATANG